MMIFKYLHIKLVCLIRIVQYCAMPVSARCVRNALRFSIPLARHLRFIFRIFIFHLHFRNRFLITNDSILCLFVFVRQLI